MSPKDYFYYFDTTDWCTNGNFSLSTRAKANYAGICAWKPSLPNVVYGCDAKGGVCWTSPQKCNIPLSIGNTSIGNDLQSCTWPSGDKWCCRVYPVERCSSTPTEPYFCWATDLCDENPLRSVALENARNQGKARITLSSMGLTLSSPMAQPTHFPTSSSNNAGTASTSNTSTTSTSNPSTTSTPQQRNDNTLSAGAGAGVAIGGIVVLGLLISSAVYLLRHRKRQSAANVAHSITMENLTKESLAHELSDARAVHELAMLPYADTIGPQRERRHELGS